MKPKRPTKSNPRVATLSFYLPEAKYDFEFAKRGHEFYSALHEIYNIARSYKKYGAEDCDDAKNALDKIWNELIECNLFIEE